MLDVNGLTVEFDSKRILTDVSIQAESNQITALVGHNGAGKTTLLRSVFGLVRPTAGSIELFGESVVNRPTAHIANCGATFVPQGHHVFRDLTVEDNLLIARSTSRKPNRHATDLNEVYALFPILDERRRQHAGLLSGGQQQMLALGMALLRDPKLMMLDEPSTGLAPVLVDQVFDTIAKIRDRYGVGILIVDQNVRRLVEFADHSFVLKAGRIVSQGSASDYSDLDVLWSLF